MNLGLDMSLKLQQKLSFQMIQSLKLLQVNTLQLEQVLRTELEQNPLLDIGDELEEQPQDDSAKEEPAKEKEADTQTDDVAQDSSEELDVSEDSVDWEEYLEEGFDMGNTINEEVDRNTQRYEPTTVYQDSLIEHLTEQLAEKKLPERKKLLLQFIIGSLDADGYLRISNENIAEITKVDLSEIAEAIQIIGTFDPVGCGARTLQECLTMQLRARGQENSLAMRLMQECWPLLEKLKLPEIARHFGVEVSEIQKTVDIIKTLNPNPGHLIKEDRAAIIIPDLIVERVDDKFVVILNDRSLPALSINKAYLRMLRRGSTSDKSIKSYIRKKLNSASWFIRAIEQRKTTMIKVMYAIIDRQQEFFDQGPPNLAPLKLQDIADMVSMHISTISRVTSNKYVQTQYGIFELKYFFSEAMGQAADGSTVSAERIKSRISQLIETENASRPLSDQQIADVLTRENLAAARRTVAKYREQLKLLPARLRQKY
ncbi:MAG: RNA polymerase factor sigma-54 [Chitinivibrionales bacterium]|nr:RNA polymerase factor sigma-54 [Chitinivibrionales bacterium]